MKTVGFKPHSPLQVEIFQFDASKRKIIPVVHIANFEYRYVSTLLAIFATFRISQFQHKTPNQKLLDSHILRNLNNYQLKPLIKEIEHVVIRKKNLKLGRCQNHLLATVVHHYSDAKNKISDFLIEYTSEGSFLIGISAKVIKPVITVKWEFEYLDKSLSVALYGVFRLSEFRRREPNRKIFTQICRNTSEALIQTLMKAIRAANIDLIIQIKESWYHFKEVSKYQDSYCNYRSCSLSSEQSISRIKLSIEA